MNSKYYPRLKNHSIIAKHLITVNPSLITQKASKPSDLLVNIHHTMLDTYGDTTKHESMEISKNIFYGYYKEVLEHYNL
jgi:hypothetical protein